jgi:hypothetical protein
MSIGSWAGAVVRAAAGREAGRVFAVLGTEDDGMLLLSDGRYRKIERPKRKKIRHVAFIGRLGLENGTGLDPKMTDRALWKALESFRNGEG